MKLVHQPPNSTCCGQAVVAMLLGLTLEDAILLVGKRGKMTTKDLVRVLRANGVNVADKLVPSRQVSLPEQCIVLARRHNSKAYHWLLYWGGFFDPAVKWGDGNMVVTSYLQVLGSKR